MRSTAIIPVLFLACSQTRPPEPAAKTPASKPAKAEPVKKAEPASAPVEPVEPVERTIRVPMPHNPARDAEPATAPATAPAIPRLTPPTAALFTLCDVQRPGLGFCLTDAQVRAIRENNRLREAALQTAAVDAQERADLATERLAEAEARRMLGVIVGVVAGVLGAAGLTALGYEAGRLDWFGRLFPQKR